MNTNSSAKTTLCYGDSNTWGRMPDRSGRYNVGQRWTGVMQDKLGSDFYIIEEGLGGRTTDLDDRGSVRNGKTYLQPCLESHNPLDFVIIMLGTNDLKFRFEHTADDVANALHDLVSMINVTVKAKDGSATKIILVSPIHIDETAPRFMEFYSNDFNPDSGEISKHFAESIKQTAIKTDCSFVDASVVAKAGEDGLHFDLESNTTLGKLLADEVKKLSGVIK
jgi:lysophospholipase L1-like esterase